MIMQWDDLRIFLSVARLGSLSGAAQALEVNQSTVSRRLSTMERALNTLLVERGRKGIALTPAGEELLQTAETVEADILNAEGRLIGRDAQIAGQVTLACPDAMLEHYLAPHLAQFSQQNRDVTLNIVSAVLPVDVMRREADVAIRISARPPETLVGRRLMDFAMAVYAAPMLRVPPDAGPDTVDWIGWTSPARTRALICQAWPNATIRHRTDSMSALLRLVRAGLGVSVLPCYLAEHDLDFTRLDFGCDAGAANGLWVLAHPDVARAARVRALTDFLSETLLADRDLFEGRSGRK